MKRVDISCPGCNSQGLTIFYHVDRVPVHSVSLISERETAINYPVGEIELGCCSYCGFITNTKFNSKLLSYSSQYESTQKFSPSFNSFHSHLATRLINSYELRNKTIIEIGCGDGDFLALLCEMGDNTGIGFDPAYREGRIGKIRAGRISFVKDNFSEYYHGIQADFICCKMTLEHIPQTAEFIKMIRRHLKDNLNTIVFFQVPDVQRILSGGAFWDIYYEHCSYFSQDSLDYLFRKCGFDIVHFQKDFDDQYLMIEAVPSERTCSIDELQESEQDKIAQLALYSSGFTKQMKVWHNKIKKLKESHQKLVIWGSGSKGVAFLTTLKVQDGIDYVVDINPFKEGMFMPGTGHKIVTPEYLIKHIPDVVIVMNPIYKKEIKEQLSNLGLSPIFLVLDTNVIH